MKELIKKIYYKYFPASKVLGYLLARKFYNNPIFVVGVGRSGTTILLETLSTHPLIISTFGEAPLIPYIGEIAYKFFLSNISTYYKKTLNLLIRKLRKYCVNLYSSQNGEQDMEIKGLFLGLSGMGIIYSRNDFTLLKLFPARTWLKD